MIFSEPKTISNPLRKAINDAYRMDEKSCVNKLLDAATLTPAQKSKIEARAALLVKEVRNNRVGKSGIDSFMNEYDLSSEEGITLMCLAEALLRIPDKETMDKLIRDKITKANWESHLGQSESVFVNATTWGLMLTGKIISPAKANAHQLTNVFKKLVNRTGEPVVRKAVQQAMRIMGKQFVMGENIQDALKRSQEYELKGYRFSYDMLGEAARTLQDAERYFESYKNAIHAISTAAKYDNAVQNPGISVKLSALYPRYELSHQDDAVPFISDKLLQLAILSKRGNIGLTVDAEEADRLDISLDIFERVFAAPELKGWEGLGLALQSYQKRAFYVLDWLVELSQKQHKKIMLRLIKGAYWDSEIKMAQERGLDSYPVFTRKANTDVSFIACAKKILQHRNAFFPQFATHNAHTVATILTLTEEIPDLDYEFQCLHGMGRALYDRVVDSEGTNKRCRVYAPVGVHEDLLAYLVRRLLENGANTSFVNRIVASQSPIDELTQDPSEKVRAHNQISHPKIPLPKDLFAPQRKNSEGLDLSNREILNKLAQQLKTALAEGWLAYPTVLDPKKTHDHGRAVYDPSDKNHIVGWVTEATEDDVELALKKATNISFAWDQTPVDQRASYLEKTADLFQLHMPQLMALAIREAGKSISDAVAEVREAIDFCRYYALCARENLQETKLPGPTGERNMLQMHGRGPVCCISPWNFPLAIFTGQVVASLVAGNPVIAKPADPTPLIAAYAVKLMHEAGIPKDVMQLLPGRGRVVGAKLVADPRIKAVVFTGSTETARGMNQTLANRETEIVPFIAETGGQNAMIVDSTALPEQVVADVITSAFMSAGQRCSALRVLFVQDDIAPKLIEMLKGAMATLIVGDPGYLNHDIGPMINADAQQTMEKHAARMDQEATLIYKVALPENAAQGHFFAPRAYELKSLSQLTREVFGPILHVIRYRQNELDKIIHDINSTGYGLTLGIHTRIDETAAYIQARVRAGNCYVNRSMIGAVVGVQPFGGEGLSGTGPKAGGPHYLYRLVTERTLTVNTTAAGGNASLMAMEE